MRSNTVSNRLEDSAGEHGNFGLKLNLYKRTIRSLITDGLTIYNSTGEEEITDISSIDGRNPITCIISYYPIHKGDVIFQTRTNLFKAASECNKTRLVNAAIHGKCKVVFNVFKFSIPYFEERGYKVEIDPGSAQKDPFPKCTVSWEKPEKDTQAYGMWLIVQNISKYFV